MNTIHFHGALKRRFGGPYAMAVTTPAEAVHALCSQLPGLEQALRAGAWRIRRGALAKGSGRFLRPEELRVNLPGEMHILAAPAGAGGGRGQGTAKVIVGVVLIAAALVVSGGTLAPVAVSGMPLALSTSTVAMFGAAMLFTGVSQLLSTQAKPTDMGDRDTKASFLLSGQINSSDQGVPVPLVLGRVRVGSVIISAGIDTEAVGAKTPTEAPSLTSPGGLLAAWAV